MGEQIKDDKIVVRINGKFKNDYKSLCESLGYTYSKRIISLLKKDYDVLSKIKNDKENGNIHSL